MENENTSTSLAVSDIITMKHIINIVSARGAFKPEEMLTVGQLYTKLTQFIDSVAESNVSTESNTQGE